MKGNPARPGGPLTSKPTWSNTQGYLTTSAFFLALRSLLRNEGLSSVANALNNKGRCLLKSDHGFVEQLAGRLVARPLLAAQSEEVLVLDARAKLTPSDMVDSKIASLLNRMPHACIPWRLGVSKGQSYTRS
jgi:hypothetical protein